MFDYDMAILPGGRGPDPHFSYTGAYFDSLERPPETKAKIRMISGEEQKYPRCVSRALHFDSHHDRAGHPYRLPAMAGLIAQEYAGPTDRSGTERWT